MRDLAFFDKQADYIDWMTNDVLAEVKGWDSPFYNNLIDFVLHTRTPIFYTISDPSEHFAFSGAYLFETRRERYPNKTREALFWMHDFTHMIFPYPHDLWKVSEAEFLNTFWYQERLASSETEILSYYRVPGLRAKVFPDEKLWFDVMIERGEEKPKADQLLHRRIRVQMDDDQGERELGEYPDILKWIRSWRTLTPKWVNQRYRSMAGVRVPTIRRPIYGASTYEHGIGDYAGHSNYNNFTTQDDYERSVMANIHVAFAILGWEDPPERWRHVPEAFDQLEGAVFFKNGN